MKTRDRVIAPIEWMKDTLASAGQAIADSDFFWMIEEIAWPLIQGLGILLALLVFAVVWIMLAYYGGDDEEEEEENPLGQLLLEEEEDHRAAILMDRYPDVSRGQFFDDRVIDDQFIRS